MNEHCIFLPGCGFKKSIWDEVTGFDDSFTSIDLPPQDNMQKMAVAISKSIAPHSTLVGWSLGGLIAIYLAHHYPHLCKKLILISTSAQFFENQAWHGISQEKIVGLQNMFLDDKKQFKHYFLQLVQYPSKQTSLKNALLNHVEINSQTLNHLHFIQSVDLKKEYESLEIPIDYLIGEQDAIVNSNAAAQLHTLNQKTRITILPRAGHALPLTHAKDIYDHIRQSY